MFKFLRNLRINSLISQCSVEFSKLSRTEKAYSILMAADWMFTIEKESPIYVRIFKSPMNFTVDQCSQVYSDTESIRKYQEKRIKQLINSQDTLRKSWGFSDTSAGPNHSKMMHMGLLFWLIKLSGFINSKKRIDAELVIEALVKNIEENDIDAAMTHYDASVRLAKSMGHPIAIYDKNILRKSAIELLQDINNN